MIVKVQRSIWPPDADALVYDKGAKLSLQIPLTPELERMFGPKLKIYCEASYDEKLTLHYVVPDRSW